ncbi:amidohydrolase family protein [Peptoniphilus sp. SGI.035]|uniref:amidohydrolase family protein n=1 Tax=Peptoniphilus sp. SGI.035 TaxID=3420564 RepID=UPI003D07F1BC
MDIKIINGKIIDPKNNINTKKDLLIDNGKIIDIGDFKNIETFKTVDAKDCYVVPGLIDYHIHLQPFCEIGVPPEIICFSSGVTTAVDAGSSGCSNYESYRPAIEASNVRIKAYLNVCSGGMVTSSYGENIDPSKFNEKKIVKLFEKYNEDLVALKIRLDKSLVQNMGMEPLKAAKRISEKIGKRLVVHTTNSPMSQIEIANELGKGDVFTHMYHDFGNTIINNKGKIFKEIIDARKRGVIFDAANARFHFSFKIANKAFENNFLPDIISTDLTKKSIYKKPQIFNMMFLISKYLNMGLSMSEIIEKSSYNPAKLINMDDKIGSISKGYCADIAIIKEIDKDVIYEDWSGGKLKGKKLLKNMMTIREGEIVFQDIEF